MATRSDAGLERSAHLGRLIKQIDMSLERQLNNSLRGSSLTRSQAFMLQLLVSHGGQASLKELEADAGVAQSTVWGVTKRLEEKGFVSVEPDPNDARARLARLTTTGEAECTAGIQGAAQLEAYLSEVFSPDEHARLTSDLKRMRDAVDAWQQVPAQEDKA